MEIITNATVGAVGGGLTAIAGKAALYTFGFSSSGVIAGSLAAGTQAGIGNVAAGTVFAGLQSVAATGAIISAAPYLIGGGAIIAVGTMLI